MNISILMTVFKRAEQLKRTLPVIMAQMTPGDELICVDDGPYDGIDKVLGEHGSLNYRWIKTGNNNYRNSAPAKNIGLKAAKNELILIHEAEILGEGSYIDQMKAHFEKGEHKFVSAANVTSLNAEGMAYGYDPNSQAPFVAGVLRQDLMDITGWDERYKYWGNEDNDLMDRLGKNGVQVQKDPNIRIYHIWHERPPADAMGDCNDDLHYKGDRSVIKVNEGKPWGIL